MLGPVLPAGSLSPVAPSPQEPLAAPKTNRRWLIGSAVAIAALLLAAWAYWQFGMDRAKPVVVEIASLAPVTRVLAVNGRIASVHSVDLRPLVSGTLETLAVAEGDDVVAGQVLGKVNADSQNAIVRQAMAGLDSALVVQQQAEEAYDRSLKLGSNVARYVLENDKHAVQTAQQEVARQSAVLDQALVALENHTIHAAIAGSILVKNVDIGQIVDPSTVLLVLADMTELLVETDIDEAYSRQIKLGQSAVLQLTGEVGTHTGKVSFVSTRVDADTGGLSVRISFDQAISAPVGMTVTTNIVVDQRNAALTLPRTALVTSTSGTDFFRVESDRARRYPVTVVEWPAERLIATEGLAEGDAVVVDADGMVDGEPVDIVKH